MSIKCIHTSLPSTLASNPFILVSLLLHCASLHRQFILATPPLTLMTHPSIHVRVLIPLLWTNMIPFAIMKNEMLSTMTGMVPLATTLILPVASQITKALHAFVILKTLVTAMLPLLHTIIQVILADMAHLMIMTTAMVTTDIKPTTTIKMYVAITAGTMGIDGRTATDTFSRVFNNSDSSS
jgi:hypothetical protein